MRDDISEVDVATKPKVIKLFEEEFNVDEDDETPFASFMMEFAEDYGISLNEREMEELEKTKLMESVFETLSRKLAQRPANDGTVHYGKMWSWELTRETRQYFDRMGGLRGAGRGAPLKHCSSVFDILGSSHGLTDRVPEDERVGRLAEAADPIRVYLRTQSSGSPTDYRGLVAYLNADLAKNKDSEHAVYFDYRDVDDLIDDGWAID
jgi:hypothetical protein